MVKTQLKDISAVIRNRQANLSEKSLHQKLLEKGYFPYSITASKIEVKGGILIPDAFFQKSHHIPSIIKLLEDEVNERIKGYAIIPIEFVPELIVKESRDVKYAIYVKE